MTAREDDLVVRAAKAADAAGMSSILAEILTEWKSGRASDAPYVRTILSIQSGFPVWLR